MEIIFKKGIPGFEDIKEYELKRSRNQIQNSMN